MRTRRRRLETVVCLQATLALLLVSTATADLFTSIAEMQSLLQTEKSIPKIISDYINNEQKRLNEIKRLAEAYDKSNEDAIKAGIKQVTNPINAYLLIKRKIWDWRKIEDAMRRNAAEDFVDEVKDSRLYGVKFPDEEDVSGAAIGLLRLQDTYRLDTAHLANGQILGHHTTNSSLSAQDCFDVGRAAYNVEDYYHTILWMEEASRRLDQERPNSEQEDDYDQLLGSSIVNKADILEYLSFSMYKQGNLKHALQLNDQLYALAPRHPRAKGNVKWYEEMLEKEGVRKSEMRKYLPRPNNPRNADGLANGERTVYEALCRGEVPVSVKETSKLYCYLKRDRPYLRLAPFKVEIVRFNPLAVLFRNVLVEKEIAVIKELATPKLARATVQDSQTGQLVTATYRISKSAWLKGWEHDVVDRVNKRIELMTNLDMETAEELQIANYGIGGHYDPHFDAARKDEKKAFDSLGTGNRIATVLFYMSQPSQGGGTVFTEVKSTIMPSLYDALFWYNLRRNGDIDERTRHAACPVLTGVKWVSNKWIHEKGQETRRPCGLRFSDAERYVGDLGGPEPRDAPNLSPI